MKTLQLTFKTLQFTFKTLQFTFKPFSLQWKLFNLHSKPFSFHSNPSAYIQNSFYIQTPSSYIQKPSIYIQTVLESNFLTHLMSRISRTAPNKPQKCSSNVPCWIVAPFDSTSAWTCQRSNILVSLSTPIRLPCSRNLSKSHQRQISQPNNCWFCKFSRESSVFSLRRPKRKVSISFNWYLLHFDWFQWNLSHRCKDKLWWLGKKEKANATNCAEWTANGDKKSPRFVMHINHRNVNLPFLI